MDRNEDRTYRIREWSEGADPQHPNDDGAAGVHRAPEGRIGTATFSFYGRDGLGPDRKVVTMGMERIPLNVFARHVGMTIDDFVDARIVAEQEDEATAVHKFQTMGEWLAELAAWQEAFELGVLDGGMAAGPDRRTTGERRKAPR